MLRTYAAAAILDAHLALPQGLRSTAHKIDFHYQVEPGYLYIRSRAISSRTNDNFDGFPPEEIKRAYKTFVGKPVFVNHTNHDAGRARGVILDAALHEDTNPDGSPDTWVEVLMQVDAIRFPKLAAAVLAGEIDRTSMGVDVEYSICTACGNRASTIAEYCAHIPRLKGQTITRKLADGSTQKVLVAERCYGLRFFENSLLVEEPADPTAHLLGIDERGLSLAATKQGLNEVVVPPKVDTLRDRSCPFCGATDGFNGTDCAVCQSVVPPDEFLDPDLDAAAREDLRDEQATTTLTCDECKAPGEGEPGDACPNCGAGVLGDQGANTNDQPDPSEPGPENPLEDQPSEDSLETEDQVEVEDPPTQPFGQDNSEPQDDSEEDDSDRDEGEDEKKDKSPPKKKPFARGATMGPVLAALAAQQRRIGVLEKAVRLLAGPNNPHIAQLLTVADTENPAQPIPEPAPSAPAATTEEALSPDATDSVDNPGGTSGAQDVGPDATDDVTKPVAGTTEMRPLDEVKIETDVQVGNPNAAEVANPLQGPFAEKATLGAAHTRTWAALRLARLRIQAGIAHGQGDDLVYGQALDTDATLATSAMQAEIATLSQVLANAQAAQRAQPARNLVPQVPPRQATRSAPSLAPIPDPDPVLVGADDSALFE